MDSVTKVILLDIEGTTTTIDFVHKVLFPFARQRIGEYVFGGFGRLGNFIAELETEHSSDADYPAAFDRNSPQSVSNYLKYLIDVDRKSTPLKVIQGEIWSSGYESGMIKSDVFADVPPAFARWKTAGKTIAIYSSGSVLAQQLLFRYTDHGDLTEFISYYFDTNVGHKAERDSYVNIAESLDVAPQSILFVSDVPSELAAARDAGLSAILSVRKGNAQVENSDQWPVATSFDEIG